MGLVILAVVGGFFTGKLTSTSDTALSTEIDDAVFLEVFNDLYQDHYSQPSKEQLYEGAIQGMIDSLKDPHTTYFNAAAYSEYQSNFGESYVGIGVRVLFQDNLIVVEEVFDGGPAQDAGIRPNDIITSVDGQDVTNQDIYETLSMIVGDEGTQVTVGVTRAGVENEIPFVMTRAVIQNSSVEYNTFVKENKVIGYIKVNQFGDETASKFDDALVDLENSGIDGLIVDLRYNGGGHLSAVLQMLQEFLLKNDKPIFSTEYYTDGNFKRDEYFGIRDSYKSYNIVTLVNEGSASASEVFASAMQEHGNYPLIGTRTYGKGTMQVDRVIQTTENDRLHLSIGRWLTSDGNWVHFNGGTDGIEPNVTVEPSIYDQAYKMFLFNGETFHYDMVDSRIANMQIILQALGYDVRTDGYFDFNTKEAIRNIQSSLGVTVNGIVDNEFLGYLNDMLDAYQHDTENDNQLQTAISYLLEHPNHD